MPEGNEIMSYFTFTVVDITFFFFFQACKLAIRECIEADIKREKDLTENPDRVSPINS